MVVKISSRGNRWLQILEHLNAAEALAAEIEQSAGPGTQVAERVAGQMVRKNLSEARVRISSLANQIQRINTIDVTGGEKLAALELPEPPAKG